MVKKVTRSVLLVVTIAAAFFAGTWHRQKEAVNASGLHGRRILYYVDPMHPSYKSDKPGIAPDCGMALEPIYADGEPAPDVEADSSGGIAVDGAKQQAIGVRVSEVEQGAGVERLRLFGRVAAAETQIYTLNAGLDGYVREISGVTTGSQVRKDEWLLTYSAPEIRQPIQGYLSVLESADREMKNGTPNSVQSEAAKASFDQYVDRLITLGMSRPQIDEIRQTRVVPPNIKVTAPADGFVIARNVTTGERVPKGTELYRIANLRQVWVFANVPAQDAGLVRPGMAAEIALAGRAAPIRARVSTTVLPQFDPTTQSSKVRLDVENADFALRPDQFVDVQLLVPYSSVVTVPAEAIVASGLRTTVFIERTAGVFEPREIRTGRRHGDRVEVLNGLTPGERIVVSGTFLLDSESRMRAHDQQTH